MRGITLKEVGGELVINVPNEATVIGRGQFLQVTDKRVSRSHALIEVSDGKLYITPTHTNPCFLRAQGTKEQKILTRDVKQLLDEGDEFGLLPDQLFYRVSYSPLSEKEGKSVKKEETKSKADDKKENNGLSNGSTEVKHEEKPSKNEKDVDEPEASKSPAEVDEKKESKDEDSENEEQKESHSDAAEEDQGEATSPLKKKRALPDWMVKVAESPTKEAALAKKPKPAPSKKPGPKSSKPVVEEDDEEMEENEEAFKLKKAVKGREQDDSEDEDQEPEDDDYVPEQPSTKKVGRSQKKQASGSEEELSPDDDHDDDYSPRKAKSKAPKKTPKSRAAGGKAKKPAARTPKSSQRNRTRRKNSDDEAEALPRRGRQEADDDAPSRRPQRAARQKRGSYVDDPMIEEALEDFASDNDQDVNEDKDSDFHVDGEEDSGSDWEKSKNRQKASKSKSKVPPRGPTKRVAASKKRPRRAGKAKGDSDIEEEEEEVMEDDEPYVPRPSKRRGATVSQESEESDEGAQSKKRKREPCQYGKKCYRKNPVHFRTFCHPGDSSYDEEEKDSSSPKETSKKDKEPRVGATDKPSRPQRTTAGTRLVTTGSEDGSADEENEDKGLPHSEESEADDSDYSVDKDVGKKGKKQQKAAKLVKAAGSD